MQNYNSTTMNQGEKKSAAQLCEAILRSVWNLEIKYTSGMREPSNVPTMPAAQHLPPQIRIGRIGSIGGSGGNPMVEYLSAVRHDDEGKAKEKYGDDHYDYIDNEFSDTAGSAVSMSSHGSGERIIPWSPKDQRRYDKSLVLFNAVLAAYAKLSSSASGVRQEVRRDMVQNAERLLLEVAANKVTAGAHFEPSPSTILQCLQPDVISFNTTMKALSEWAPRQKWNEEDRSNEDPSMGTATAERTESILEVMQDLCDEERKSRTTLQSMQAAWKEQGYGDGRAEKHAPPPSYRAIAPDTSSYNIVLKAWSRSSDPDDALRALKLYQTMIHRSNVACLAKDSLILQHSEPSERKSYNRVGDAFP
eukprot:CAMPEP_0172326454 /NCGR_PEP_ID=MMETSP1058-20130122/56571_1 /TAXON_ID=83371 /ORGANISM="Detonula confervacea, Strain CCMP 353" /LENGTH=361 /DNA_ID=CAMNT_0013043237 /DNA_START=1 /DNA_END=1083 /DNA_ORIENTATION=+